MNCKHSLSAFKLVGLFLLTAASARADVIYTNGSPQLVPVQAQGALFADAGNPGFSAAADDFILQGGLNTIRDIHWWGVYSGTLVSDNFSINIYNNNAGTVGTLAAAVNIESLVKTNTGSTLSGLTLFSYDAVVSPITLQAGLTYWLGISNASGITNGNGWAWAESNTFSGSARQFSSNSGTWGNSVNDSLAFNLTNDIPEPSSVILAILGGLGLIAAGWMRRQR